MYYNNNKQSGVLISVDVFKRMLQLRREEIAPRGWTIPDLVWDEYMEFIDDAQEDAFSSNPDNNDPSYIVDNIAVNGDYGSLDDYKEEDETDEEAIDRLECEALRVFPDERFVIYSL